MYLIYPPNVSISGKVGLTIDGNIIRHSHAFFFGIEKGSIWESREDGKYLEARSSRTGQLQAVIQTN